MASFREVIFNFSGNARPLVQTLRELEAHIKRVPNRKTIHLEAKKEQLTGDIDHLQNQLELIDDMNVDPEVSANIRKLETNLARARQIVARFPDKKVMTLELRQKLERDLARINTLVARTTEGVERLGPKMNANYLRSAGAAASLTAALGRLSVVLRRIPPLMAGIAMTAIAVVVPGILAIVPAVGAAIAALGGLGAALAAAAAPVAGLLIGAFVGVNKVLEVRKAREAAVTAETKRGATAAQALAAAEDRRADAANSVRDAAQGVITAERGLADARQQAAAEIADAQQAAVDASRAVGQATEALRSATVQAYREMEDAIEAASDAVRDLESAELSLDEAKHGVAEAQFALKEFQSELGATGNAFSSMIEKFTDVDFDFDTGALQEALSMEGESDLGIEQRLELEGLILRIRRAKLQEKEATDGVSDSERNLSRTTQEANNFRRLGIAASDGYRSALEGLASAQRASAEASAEANRLQQQGISGHPAVIAATESLRDAHEGLASARRNAQRAAETEAAAMAGSSAAMDAYKEKLGELSGAQRNLLSSFDAISRAASRAFGPSISTIIDAMADSIRDAIPAIGFLRNHFAALGDAIAEEIREFSNFAFSPFTVLKVGGFVNAATRLTDVFGQLGRDFVGSFINVATGAMPVLEDHMDRLAEKMRGFHVATGDTGAVTATLAPMAEVMAMVADAAVEAGRAILNVFTAGQEPILEFIDGLRDGIAGFGEFARSAEGSEKIKKFFEDTLPFVKQVMENVFGFGKILMEVFSIVGPILTPILKAFGELGKVILFVLKAINWILTPFKGIIGAFLAFIFVGGAVGKLFKGIGFLFKNLGNIFRWIVGAAFNTAKGLAAPFIGAWRLLSRIFPAGTAAIANVLRKLVGVIGTVLKSVGKVLIAPFRVGWRVVRTIFNAAKSFVGAVLRGYIRIIGGILRVVGKVLSVPFRAGWALVRTIFNAAKNAIVKIVRGLIDAVKKVLGKLAGFAGTARKAAKKVFDAIKGIFSGLAGMVRDAFRAGLRAIKNGINLMIKAVNWIIGKINAIPNIKVPGLGKVGIPDIPKIPYLASGGLITDETAAVLGEGGDEEAVLPLNKRVMARLAAAIVGAMKIEIAPTFGGQVRLPPAVAAAERTRPQTVIENAHFPINAPAGGVPDAETVAVSIARRLERRAHGSPRA